MHDEPTGGVAFLRPIVRTPTSSELRSDAEVLHHQVAGLLDDTARVRRTALVADLEAATKEIARLRLDEMLERLSSEGISWRDVARVTGVSVPAVQKWRRGGDITGENRLKLARLIAMLDVLQGHLITQSVSWLEMPVKHRVGLSRMDLLWAGREDLVLELISDDGDERAIDEILDEYAPDWRTSLVDDAFESFVAGDGRMSVRPRR